MNKVKRVPKVYADTDLVSLPVYMPYAKYKQLSEICKGKRMPMTKIVEAEIDKFIKRETPTP